MAEYAGGCHCGRVRFRYEGPPIEEGILCNCSVCSMKGFVHLIVPRERFKLISGAEELLSYRFGTGVAEHMFCQNCGIHPFYTPRSDPEKIDINLRCVDGLELGALTLKSFDGQNWEEAIDSAAWRNARSPEAAEGDEASEGKAL